MRCPDIILPDRYEAKRATGSVAGGVCASVPITAAYELSVRRRARRRSWADWRLRLQKRYLRSLQPEQSDDRVFADPRGLTPTDFPTAVQVGIALSGQEESGWLWGSSDNAMSDPAEKYRREIQVRVTCRRLSGMTNVLGGSDHECGRQAREGQLGSLAIWWSAW